MTGPVRQAHRPDVVESAAGRATVGTLVYVLLGPLIWAAAFMGIYALQGLVCARGGSSALFMALAGGAWLVAIVLLGAAITAPSIPARVLHADGWAERTQLFLGRAMRLLALLSIVALVWFGAVLVLLPSCGTSADANPVTITSL